MTIDWDATPFVTYGNFGGPQISGEGGAPVDSLDELFQSHDAEILAASRDAGGLTPQELVQAHANLIGAITNLPETSEGLIEVETATGETIADPEATLYAGATIIVLTAQVEQFGVDELALLEAELGSEDLDIPDALTKAADYIEVGLKETGIEETYFKAVLENQVNQFIALNLFAA
jgi:hypothetical protein